MMTKLPDCPLYAPCFTIFINCENSIKKQVCYYLLYSLVAKSSRETKTPPSLETLPDVVTSVNEGGILINRFIIYGFELWLEYHVHNYFITVYLCTMSMLQIHTFEQVLRR